MSGLSSITFEAHGRSYRADLSSAHDLAVRLTFDGAQPNAFHLDRARAEAVEADGFVGDTSRGGSANCRDVYLNPHGNGTHTECVGHIVDEQVAVGECAKYPLLPAVLLTVTPDKLAESGESYDGEQAADDRVLTRASLERTFDEIGAPAGFCDALVIRTRPNDAAKASRTYSGTNPPYPTAEAIEWLIDRGVEHLLVDLPSIDREDDGGTLPNHHLFFDVPAGRTTLDDAEPSPRTVTEMIYAPDTIADGIYLLSLHIPRFALDAAPSRPLLYGVQKGQFTTEGAEDAEKGK